MGAPGRRGVPIVSRFLFVILVNNLSYSRHRGQAVHIREKDRMKEKREKRRQKMVKGTSSAVFLSVAIHAGLFLLAGLFVVFTVIDKPEPKFTPPPVVDRPKMKLKKPQVKLKKTSRPKATAKIVTKVNRATMPDIQLPEMSGMGVGLGGAGIDGFDMLPGLDEVSVMGSAQSIGCDLVGTFYDFNRTRRGTVTGIDPDGFTAKLVQFDKSGWKTSVLSQYYQSPKKLYAITVAVPPMMSPLGPAAFDEPDNEDQCWIVLYKGQLVHRDGIRFRFVGNSDDKMAVRVDGKAVLDASRWDATHSGPQIATAWLPSSPDHRKWYMAHDYSAVGDLVELEPGVPKDIEIIIGEGPGSLFNAILYVMEEGVEYPKNAAGSPILPLFKTADLPRRLQDLIYRGMPEDEVCVTNGPTFNDYASGSRNMVAEADEPAGVAPTDADPMAVEGVRTWTTKDGRALEGELVTTMGGEAILKTGQGGQKKIPLDMLSEADFRYVELSQPPKLDLDLGKESRQITLKNDADGSVGCNEYTFTAKVKSSSPKYNHALRVEYWVLGSEIGGNKYMLLDHETGSFVPSAQPKETYSFSGKPVALYDWVLSHIYNQRRGERYEGFLITVTDERGKIVAERSQPTWLFKNLDRLRQLEVGSFMDNTCTRQWPTPLKVPVPDK